MENVQAYINAADAEHIENLVLSGMKPVEILAMHPHYEVEAIEKAVERVAKYMWYDNEEWGYFGL